MEFGDDFIVDYDRQEAAALSRLILEYERMVYEAHSTDYQTEKALRAMVEDHFCILKVGPWLTYALREALFALDRIEQELFENRKSGRRARPAPGRGAGDARGYPILDKTLPGGMRRNKGWPEVSASATGYVITGRMKG